jgi:transposase
MHIIENKNKLTGKLYCEACECIWDKGSKKFKKPSKSVGWVDVNSSAFVPNRYLSTILETYLDDPSTLDEKSLLIINTVIAKYGDAILKNIKPSENMSAIKTAQAEFIGPSLVFGKITKKYHIDEMLHGAFEKSTANKILALAWYIASEGSALINSDVWLSNFENPFGISLSSQDITRLLDSMNFDNIMTFYSQWLNFLKNNEDKVLFDLTSISYYGRKVNLAAWGHNRDNEELPQVNYALLCLRNTAMPLFAWLLNGSINDVNTLINTLEMLDKLGYKPDCLMMDRGFSSEENINYMLSHNQKFLQALKLGPDWVKRIIDIGRDERLLPESLIQIKDRRYYTSTTHCRWVRQLRRHKRGKLEEEVIVIPQHDEYVSSDENVEVIEQYGCSLHVLFCHDLVGNQWDKFMEELGAEHRRLIDDNNTQPKKEFKKYFVISKPRYARKRSVEYDLDSIRKHQNIYAGHICFLTNDNSISSAAAALNEYSTRDYIEKDFDELKNGLDMKRIRVHTDERMKARLFIQFIAEIIMREIRVCLNASDECKKLTRHQVSANIKSIYKIKFSGNIKDIYPTLSKTQRSILKALRITFPT